MSNYSVDEKLLICPKCDKGREVCTFCWNQEWVVFKQICDCGLHEQGEHVIPCEVVRDEQAHASLRADPRLDAEADHGGKKGRDPIPVDLGAMAAQPDVMEPERWTSTDDALLQEYLGEEE